MADPSFKAIIAKLVERISLEVDEAEAAFNAIMDGKASEAEIAGIFDRPHG